MTYPDRLQEQVDLARNELESMYGERIAATMSKAARRLDKAVLNGAFSAPEMADIIAQSRVDGKATLTVHDPYKFFDHLLGYRDYFLGQKSMIAILLLADFQARQD